MCAWRMPRHLCPCFQLRCDAALLFFLNICPLEQLTNKVVDCTLQNQSIAYTLLKSILHTVVLLFSSRFDYIRQSS